MSVHVACEALRSGHVFELRYDGYSRSVEVHAVGFTKEDNPIMRVWQIGGGNVSNEPRSSVWLVTLAHLLVIRIAYAFATVITSADSGAMLSAPFIQQRRRRESRRFLAGRATAPTARQTDRSFERWSD
jgi:hypothetical protein